MKLNSAFSLTLLLLLAMSGASVASALLGYKMGYEALKGVSQPEDNPTQKFANKKKSSEKPQAFKPLNEKTILIKVYNHIQGHHKKEAEKKTTDSPEKAPEPKKSPDKVSSASASSQVAQLPLRTSDQGVSLAVVKATQQGGSLLLDINLKNEGEKAVQFLYSFLEIKDNQGRSLGAITEGLPSEVPPNGANFAGVVRIPTGLVDNDQSLSLNLTDYPDQKLKLAIAGIPVVR